MPNWRRRFDRHSRRLFLSERLAPADRLREVALESCLLAFGEVISAEAATFAFTSDEARRLARFELLRYAAHALMMPYAAFQAAAAVASAFRVLAAAASQAASIATSSHAASSHATTTVASASRAASVSTTSHAASSCASTAAASRLQPRR